MQFEYCKDLKRCYMGNAPTLSELNKVFGENITESWVAIQIRDLSEFSGVKSKLNPTQIDMLAKVIIASFYYLKVTEIMHFFLLFKSGKYSSFYGAVDGLVITKALQDFCRDRNERLYQFEQEERKRIEEAERERSRKNAVSYDEYLAGKNAGIYY